MKARRLATVAAFRQASRVLADGPRACPTLAHTLGHVADVVHSCTRRPAAFVLFDDAALNRMERGRCRNRHCPHCHNVAMAHLGTALSGIIADELKAGSRLAMLTLPIKHGKHDDLKTLRKDFSRAMALLLKSRTWQAVVAEYHRVVEIERGPGGWNVHAHLLIKVGPVVSCTIEERRYSRRLKRSIVKRRKEKRVLTQQELQDLYFQGGHAIKAVPLYRVWRRWARSPGRSPGRSPWAYEFLSLRACDLEDLLRAEWQRCTARVGRPSFVVRYKEVRPGTTPGTVLKRWRDKAGADHSEERPVEKFVQELVKYVCKGAVVGRKRRQTGLLALPPWRLAEYVRGVKHWHLHQSSQGWMAAQRALESAEEGDERLSERDDGGRRVGYTELVRTMEDAVTGLAGKPGEATYERALADGLAALRLMESGGDVDERVLAACRSHLAALLGCADPPDPWPLTMHEKVALNRLRGREWRPRVSRQEADLALLEATADREAAMASAGYGWSMETEAAYQALRAGSVS